MTETINTDAPVTDESAATGAETPSKNIPELSTFADNPMVDLVVTKAKVIVENMKKTAEQLSAAGNVGDLLSEAIQKSELPAVKSNLERIQKANEMILQWQKENEAAVKPTLDIPSDEKIAALEATYKADSAAVKTFDTVFTMEVVGTYPDLTIYDYVGELPRAKRSGGAKSGQGEGTSRPRVSSIEVSTDNGETYSKVEKDGKSTFSVLSQWLKSETGETIGASDLHEPWLAASGAKDWNALPEVSEFSYSLKGNTYFIRVTK